MRKLSVLIDTDGQIDSLWGLLIAAKTLDVKAITVSTGKNADPENAFQNVLGFAAMAGLSCPLSAGSRRAVLNREKPRWNRFAPDGKCGLALPRSALSYEEIPAWDRIYLEAQAAAGELVILCFGPMTNLALAIFKYPDLPKLIRKVAFVGGSYDYGNYTAVTEINMATDPEAAKAVFQSGIQLEMYGYNVQLSSSLTSSEIGRIVNGDGPYSTAFALSGMSHKPDEPIYYGPALAVMGLANPETVTFARYNVFLETKGTLCRGRTTPLNMYTPLGYSKDTLVAMELDKSTYVNLLKDTLALYEELC